MIPFFAAKSPPHLSSNHLEKRHRSRRCAAKVRQHHVHRGRRRGGHVQQVELAAGENRLKIIISQHSLTLSLNLWSKFAHF